MDSTCPPGSLSYPGGIISFGAGKPTLCVNDQCGYAIQHEKIRREVESGNFSSLTALAQDGMDNGLAVFNVQLMEPSLARKEEYLLPKAVKTLYEETGCAIAVDTRNPDALGLALEAYPYKALCNCVNGEWSNLEAMLPVVHTFGAAVGTALVDEQGVPGTLERRLSVASRILEAAGKFGIPKKDVMMDAVCLPSGVCPDSMRMTLETIQAFHRQLEVPALVGNSNAGYMMPNPLIIDSVYFTAAVSWGLDVAMISPYTPNIQWIAATIDFLMGTDPYAGRYLELYRSGTPWNTHSR